MKTSVFVTIDTENSMGGAWADPSLNPVPTERRIHCKIGDEDFGVGWICQELSSRGMAATFFGEVFSSLVFGEDDTKRWVQYLLDQGQDVQLHTHLNFLFYSLRRSHGAAKEAATDDLVDLEPSRRIEVLEQACAIFRRVAGYEATAFRAGNWKADRLLLTALPAFGINLDSSFNPAFQGCGSFDALPLSPNLIQQVDDVWELPLTAAWSRLVDGGFKTFDIVSTSCQEISAILGHCHQHGVGHVHAVLHSFSGVKASDVQYTRLRPNHVVRRRLKHLLSYISEHDDQFRTTTMRQLAVDLRSAAPKGRSSLPELGLFRPLARKVVQGVNRSFWV